ncbi:ArsR family transcriptional regulator [Haloarcula sp. Atlit-47R]|uniref:winged helix-turn-helix domain-containing protein n=1 Tax=Haloarcula sp. Atlit-47R TaxID=2282132 RepID=UPI000EF23993|nr:winged helix-turn-helix domain-containing protein [Haloarcula sp. Atlit-47R]RLM41882.1 ArsR family transcriptional regulator [Haloarcula sp. Atlit-47R]
MTSDQIHIESFGDEAPLTYLFGTNSRVKILSTLIAERGRDLSISEIARQSGVARSTVYEHIDPLVKLGVVVHTRDARDGHSPMYQLNEDSDIAVVLYQLEGYALEQLIESDEFE